MLNTALAAVRSPPTSACATHDPAAAVGTTATQASPLYRPELDALRFFAFLAVYLYHVLNTEASGRFMHHRMLGLFLLAARRTCGFGLCLFFFLSSYLITSLLRVEQTRTGTVNLRNFYVRRILRIWPLYLVFLAGVSMLGSRWGQPALEPWRLVAFLGLYGNWYSILFGIGTLLASHLWSISVEEQFYVVGPLLLLKLPPRRLGGTLVGLCLFSLAATWTLAATGSSSRSIWLNSLSQSLFFAAGALLALRASIRSSEPSLVRAMAGIAGGLLLWFACGLFSGFSDPLQLVVPVRITIAYALVACGCWFLLSGFLRLPRALLPRPLLYLGRISYGLYVFHAVVLIALASVNGMRLPGFLRFPGIFAVLGLAGTIGTACLSYYGIERPFLKLKRRFEKVATRPA